MIIQRGGFLEHVKEMKKAHSAYECSSSEKYEEIHFLLLPNNCETCSDLTKMKWAIYSVSHGETILENNLKN